MANLLDELVKGQQELESLKQQKESLTQQLTALQAQVKETSSQAERQSRAILQQAKDDAKLILKQAEDQAVEAAHRLKEATAREHAVAYVKEEEAKLNVKAEQVATAQADAQRVLSDATAQKSLYENKLKELKSWEDALVKRE